MSRAAIIFGQFGVAADPVSLPHFRDRLAAAGVDCMLVQHTDTQKVYDFLKGYRGKIGIFGSSLGAGIAPICAGYLQPQLVDFVGGFQPSDYDPVMHIVNLRSFSGLEIIRAVTVPNNVRQALCFRNPILALTGGLGHATYVASSAVRLRIVEREDAHPGDFGEAQDEMFETAMKALT